MALLAESLVEEWLNRQSFFTIRGLKQGVSEIDLLALRHRAGTGPEAWHIESQVSFRPVSYITPLTDALATQLGKKRTSAFERTPEQLVVCVTDWVTKKFRAKKKALVREILWPGADWQLVVVHGVVKHPAELELIASQGVTLVFLGQVLEQLCSGVAPPFTGSAGGDLADLIAFHAKQHRARAEPVLLSVRRK